MQQALVIDSSETSGKQGRSNATLNGHVTGFGRVIRNMTHEQLDMNGVRADAAIARRAERLTTAIQCGEIEASTDTLAAIENRGSQTEFDVLAELLVAENVESRREAARCLQAHAQSLSPSERTGRGPLLSPEGSKTLVDCLQHTNDAAIRRQLLQSYEALHYGEPAELVPILAGCLNDSVDDVRIAALQAITAVGADLSSGVVDEVAALTDDPFPDVRSEAYAVVEWLGRDAAPAAGALMRRVLVEHNLGMRQRATRALVAVAVPEDFADLAGDDLQQLSQAIREVGESGRDLRRHLATIALSAQSSNAGSDAVVLNKSQIASYLDVSPRTVTRLLESGDLVPIEVLSSGVQNSQRRYRLAVAVLEVLKRANR